MNICCLTHEYPPVGGGGAVTIHETNLKLSEMGHNINVLTTTFRDIPKRESIGSIHIERLCVKRTDQEALSTGSMALYSLAGTCHALRHYGKNDIIHSYFVIPAGIPGYFMKKIRKKPLIVTVFGGDIYDPTKFRAQRRFIDRLVTRRILESADRVTTISHDLESRIKSICDADIEIVHCGVDVKSFNPDTGNARKALRFDDSVHILSVGRLVKRKGFDNLLRAMRLVLKEHKNIKLNIIGHGPEKRNLEGIIKNLGLQNNVYLLGFVDRKNLIWHYKACDIFAMSSLHEGQCCTILEAMSCKKPIVATNVGGIPDSVVNRHNGILVTPNDPKKMADALLELVQDRKKRTEFGRNSRKRALEKFDWSIIAKQMDKIYSEIF